MELQEPMWSNASVLSHPRGEDIHTSSWCRDAEVEATYSLHRKCPQVRNEGAGSQKSDQSHSVIRVRRYDGGRE